MKTEPAEILVINLKSLMGKTALTSSDLSKKSGVSKRMIDYILNGDRKATIELTGKLADAFGLAAWQLIMPSLPYDIAKNGTLNQLIKDFSACATESQDYIRHLAQRDAIYKREQD